MSLRVPIHCQECEPPTWEQLVAWRRLYDYLARNTRAPWWTVPLAVVTLALDWLNDHTRDISLAIVMVGSLAAPQDLGGSSGGNVAAPALRVSHGGTGDRESRAVARHLPDERADHDARDQGGRGLANMARQPGRPAAGSEVDLPSEVIPSAATRRRPGVLAS